MSNGAIAYHAADSAEIDVGKLSYFAVSVFWRTSISGRAFDGNENRIELGPVYNERFRRFLFGLQAFPEDALLIVVVSPSVVVRDAVAIPSGQRFSNGYFWRFFTPGMMFDLGVGKGFRESKLRKACLVRSTHSYIFVHDILDFRLDEAMLTLRKTARSLVK